MTTQKDRLYVAFKNIKRDLALGLDAAAFTSLQRIVKSEVIRAKRAK